MLVLKDYVSQETLLEVDPSVSTIVPRKDEVIAVKGERRMVMCIEHNFKSSAFSGNQHIVTVTLGSPL